MLGLAQSLPNDFRTAFISFSENGLCQQFLDEVRRAGFEGISLKYDTPRLIAAVNELTVTLRKLRTDVLCCHGYKANLLGLLATRWIGIPVVAVSRGWTGESFRIRIYEALDRCILRCMNKVVCVSEAQAKRVHHAGVRPNRVEVIRNAIRPERFVGPDPKFREILLGMFAESPEFVVGAAGRLSPEKGFEILIKAARTVLSSLHSGDRNGEAPALKAKVGFVLFGDGPLRSELSQQITACDMEANFVLAGFSRDFDRFLPHFDLFVQSSFTEGLPNVVLEAQACGVPVVATSVGGTPELIENGTTGWLIRPGDSDAMAGRIASALSDPTGHSRVSRTAYQNVCERFSFAAQASAYRTLFEDHMPLAASVCPNGLKTE